MFEVYRKELMWGGRRLVLETGNVARQADGAVLATYGETTVLCTAVAKKQPKPGHDFFPLTVNYQEKTFAAGKIPGGFFKREGRPSEKEVLTSRLIDRPIRPLFADGLPQRDPSRLHRAEPRSGERSRHRRPDRRLGGADHLRHSVPGPDRRRARRLYRRPICAQPELDELPNSQLDLVVAGTAEGVLMVESEAKELSEDVMLGAVMFGHEIFQPVIQAIIELAEAAAKEPWTMPAKPAEGRGDRSEAARCRVGRSRAAYAETQKQARSQQARRGQGEDRATLFTEEAEQTLAGKLFKELEKDIVRGAILDGKPRIDGRDTKTVRPIAVEVGVLPRAHGSALFTRGETQALVVTTLGTGQDEQIIDALEGEYREHFMLHYNFPPYSTGEAGRMGSPGPARDRPWQARLARGSSAAAGEGKLPLHDPRRLGDHRIERLVLDGDGVRRPRCR